MYPVHDTSFVLSSPAERDFILGLIPKVGCILEIGSFCGINAAHAARERQLTSFDCVDTFELREDQSKIMPEATGFTPNELARLFWHRHRTQNMRLYDSIRELDTYKYDVIIIDGHHNDCLETMLTSIDYLRQSGIMIVLGYKVHDGITAAVDKFVDISGGRRLSSIRGAAAVSLRHRPPSLAVCTVVKNEARHIIEWIEFHKLIGVSKFYIYDNDSNDNLWGVLKRYIDSGEVAYIPWPGGYRQVEALTNCLNLPGIEEWVALIDVDEFLFATSSNNLPYTLLQYQHMPGIMVNQVMFTTSGHNTMQQGLVIENYTRQRRRLPDGQLSKIHNNGKTIVQPKFAIGMRSAHDATYITGCHGMTETGDRHGRFRTTKYSITTLRINHYITKSRDEAIKKWPNLTYRAKAAETLEAELEECGDEDLAIQRFVPELSKLVEPIEEEVKSVYVPDFDTRTHGPRTHMR